jgi:hypothetical protein
MEILTTDDLQKFKVELLDELKILFEENLKPHQIKKWIKTPEVLRILKISASTLQTLRLNGTIPYTKMGCSLYYDNQDITQILTDNKTDNKTTSKTSSKQK